MSHTTVTRTARPLLVVLCLLALTVWHAPNASSQSQTYTPADSALATSARNVLNRFAQYRGQYWIAGQQEVHWDSGRKDEMSNAVAGRTSPQQLPGLRGWDFPFGGGGSGDAQWMIDTMISDWNNAKVLPTISQHWTPYSSQGTNHDDMFVRVNINNIFVSGTSERSRYLAWRTNVADDMQKLQAAGVPVLWRPFHEAGGGWFWWDLDGSSNYKRLWNDLWDYLVNTRGLHNMIWVWSPGKVGVGTDWYPGDSRVDILGIDVYSVSSADYRNNYNDLGRFSGSKLRAISECDYMMDPAALSSAPFSYFMVWHTDQFYKNSAGTVNYVYNQNRSVARARMGQFIGGTLGGGTSPTPTPVPGTGRTLYNFEGGSTQGWTGSNISAGPWSVTEWAANGSYALKADVALGARQTVLKLTQDQSLSGNTQLQARVRHATWGSFGSGMVAKLYVKTGSGWTWYDGGSVRIGSSTTVLTLNLSGVANLGAVREIGVEFTSPSDSSGSSAIYVDYVTVN